MTINDGEALVASPFFACKSSGFDLVAFQADLIPNPARDLYLSGGCDLPVKRLLVRPPPAYQRVAQASPAKPHLCRAAAQERKDPKRIYYK